MLNERIVYACEMHLDDRKISVSLATVEIKPEGKDTRGLPDALEASLK